MRRPKAKSTPLVGKAPLGGLPAERGQSAATSRHNYSIGDVVFWGAAAAAGEYTFMGHPKGDTAGKVLVLAHSAEIGFEVDVFDGMAVFGNQSRVHRRAACADERSPRLGRVAYIWLDTENTSSIMTLYPLTDAEREAVHKRDITQMRAGARSCPISAVATLLSRLERVQ